MMATTIKTNCRKVGHMINASCRKVSSMAAAAIFAQSCCCIELPKNCPHPTHPKTTATFWEEPCAKID